MKNVCFNCANYANGRMTDVTAELPKLDGVRVLRLHRNPPSKKVTCSECGQKVQSFIVAAPNKPINANCYQPGLLEVDEADK